MPRSHWDRGTKKQDADAGAAPAAGERPPTRTELPPPLGRLKPERLADFLELALDPDALLRTCRKLGLSAPGYRLDKLATPDHAALLADEYVHEPRRRGEIEEIVTQALKTPALRTLWLTSAAARELPQLVAGDPINSCARLAWRFMGDGDPGVRAAADRAIDVGLELLDAYDAAAEAPPPGETAPAEQQREGAPAEPAEDAGAAREELQKRVARAERDREAARALLQQARTEIAERDRRLNELKSELATVRVENMQQASELSRVHASRTSDERKGAHDARRLASERAHLDARVRELEEQLEAERRRARELQQALTQERERPAAQATEAEVEAPAHEFVTPHFTDEFYDSLEGWDRRVVKTAFEKALLLARDRRHPSLRAIALEGIDNYFRIRIASDVRLIYRRGQDGRLEILSLIDREDLDRYIRQAKTRREG